MKYSAFFFLDLHRELYSPHQWSFGGPSRYRTYSITLPLQRLSKCEPKLCAGISYFAGNKSSSRIFYNKYGIYKYVLQLKCAKYIVRVLYIFTRLKKRINFDITNLLIVIIRVRNFAYLHI